LAFVLLAIICFGLYYVNQSILASMQAELEAVKAEHQHVSTELTQLQPGFNVLRQTMIWESHNIVWLDVLKDLSEVLPSDTELVVEQMTLTTGPFPNPRSSGSITLLGFVRDPSVLMKLQNDLQATGRYLVHYQPPSRNPAGGGYPWRFRTTIYRR
jgi:hypothetical protein